MVVSPTHRPIDNPDAPNPYIRSCLQVRVDVFVYEQGVPSENEIDSEDPWSWHWIVYQKAQTEESIEESQIFEVNGSADRLMLPKDAISGSRPGEAVESNEIEISTLRIVPPPHVEPHTYEGKTVPYVRLTRVAIQRPFRGQSAARYMVSEALGWLARSKETIRKEILDQGRIQDGTEAEWDGLVLVHSQVQVEGFWKKMGFVRDEKMGVWDEEGIMHVGMWRWV